MLQEVSDPYRNHSSGVGSDGKRAISPKKGIDGMLKNFGAFLDNNTSF